MRNINEWAAEIHRNAVEHGWWDERRNFAEIVALCHSELSEALEEDRAGRDLHYIMHGKPEGIAVELVDCVIRILDYLAFAGVDVEAILEEKHEYNMGRAYKHGKNY